MRPPAKFEFEILTYVAEHPGLSVRDLFEGYGKPKGLTRGTMVKAMDRLLKKGLVERDLVNETFAYRTKQSANEMQRNQVASFIRERLGGSLKPIAAYLVESDEIDPDELREIKRLINELSD